MTFRMASPSLVIPKRSRGISAWHGISEPDPLSQAEILPSAGRQDDNDH